MKRQTLSIQEIEKGKLFYINGSLQFDTRDEGIYHEFLAAAGTIIASARKTSPLKALILGGGDGLALREVLANTSTESVCLVDHDREVIDLARDNFSPWNKHSLFDERVKILIDDARSFLEFSKNIFDLIIADFTYPDTIEGASLYTKGFFSLVRKHLTSKGIFATNALSPTNTPRAFRSLIKTLKSADIQTLPIAVDIPSFLRSGYGTWGFLIGSPHIISKSEISGLNFPDHLRYLNRSTLKKAIKRLGRENIVSAAFSRPIIHPSDLISLLSMEIDLVENYVDWAKRMCLVLNQIDWMALLEELENYLSDLPQKFREEFEDLKARFNGLISLDRAYTVVFFLALLITFINAINPDNAYAKGGYHSYHHHGSNVSKEFIWFAAVAPTPFRFQTAKAPFNFSMWNVKGITKTRKTINASPGRREVLTLNLADTMYASLSGEIFLVIENIHHIYRIDTNGITLIKPDGGEMWKFPMDPYVYQMILSNISKQKLALYTAISEYETWMNWAGIAYKTFAKDAREVKELQTLKDLTKTYDLLEKNYPTSYDQFPKALAMQKILPGIFISEKGDVHIQQADGDTKRYSTGLMKNTDRDTLLPSKDWDQFLIPALEWHYGSMLKGAPHYDSIAEAIKNMKERNK